MSAHTIIKECLQYQKMTDELYRWYKGNGVKGAGKMIEEHEAFNQRLVGMSRVSILIATLNTVLLVGAFIFKLVK